MQKVLNEAQLLDRFHVGETVLAPLIVRRCEHETQSDDSGGADARVELALPSGEGFRFVVEAKTRGTPQAVQLAVAQAKAASKGGEWPMILVPYLSPERLAELEKNEVSGVDLCGNGIVIVPGRLLIVRSGQPNQYRDTRPVSNPYRGRSAMVARSLLQHPSWPTLTRLVTWMREQGAVLSLPQASKAVQAMEEDMLVWKIGGTINLREATRLLDKLGTEWRSPKIRSRQSVRLPKGLDSIQRLSSAPSFAWAMTGEAAASRYLMFSQGGPQRLAVSDLPQAVARLEAASVTVPNFADIELLETDEPGFFFACETDDKGIRWASRVQTWLELQAGDGRQRDAARDLRQQILKDQRPS